jgi:hypothetical protein
MRITVRHAFRRGDWRIEETGILSLGLEHALP